MKLQNILYKIKSKLYIIFWEFKFFYSFCIGIFDIIWHFFRQYLVNLFLIVINLFHIVTILFTSFIFIIRSEYFANYINFFDLQHYYGFFFTNYVILIYLLIFLLIDFWGNLICNGYDYCFSKWNKQFIHINIQYSLVWLFLIIIFFLLLIHNFFFVLFSKTLIIPAYLINLLLICLYALSFLITKYVSPRDFSLRRIFYKKYTKFSIPYYNFNIVKKFIYNIRTSFFFKFYKGFITFFCNFLYLILLNIYISIFFLLPVYFFFLIIWSYLCSFFSYINNNFLSNFLNFFFLLKKDYDIKLALRNLNKFEKENFYEYYCQIFEMYFINIDLRLGLIFLGYLITFYGLFYTFIFIISLIMGPSLFKRLSIKKELDKKASESFVKSVNKYFHELVIVKKKIPANIYYDLVFKKKISPEKLEETFDEIQKSKKGFKIRF